MKIRQVRTTVYACILLAAAQGMGNAQTVGRWSWQEPQAKVLPTGDLEWMPQTFEYKTGAAVRYIDFESGSDANDGLSKQTPWKHHPWDPDADGQAKACRGVHTYVFKQGVTYRGQMEANESGAVTTPIVLTRDPSWGEGPAVLCGSEAVTGWKKGADNHLIPEPEKVWYVDLDWAVRSIWMVGRDGTVTRIALARTPNWTITDLDDIQSEWWTWKNPDKPFDNYATINGQRRHLAFDKENINESRPQDYYEGAIVWTTKGWVMGSPFQARVLAVDREKGSLTFPGQWGGAPSYKIIRGCRYYLEDKPHYLDSPGEFWFDKKGDGGRLYLRLPGDQDPNTVRVEVAKRIRMIDSRGMSHVHVRGLTFRFTNIYWNLTAAPYWVSHESIDVEPGCVRLLGSGMDIQVTHCAFEHVHRGVRLKAMGPQDTIDRVVVEDNVFSEADAGGVELADGTTYGDVDGPTGRLYDVRVRRNKFDHIGIRPDLFGQGGALVIKFAQTAEVAGNMFERVCAQGIDVYGAKPSGAATDRPFTRLLIHHNKAVDTLLNNDDFGGIETWQGGPAYVYDNISGNPGGYRNWDHVLSPETEDRFGHAYYLDGAFKNYYFNNIAWGKSKGPAGKLANTSAFQEIISYQNTFFNNTIYNFVRGSRRQEPQAGRVKFLGNIFQSMGLSVFRDADPARTAAGNAGAPRNPFALDTNAYARNVFYDIGVGEGFGVLEPSGKWLGTFQAFRDALEGYRPLAATVGVMAQQSPLRDPAAHDFRPAANSAARGQGARVFVPWSLYETVGEWNFYPIQGEPARILDEHWCMSPYYTGRDSYYKLPTYPLKGVNLTLKDYENGPLENWTTGALHFNGRDQYAVLANEDIDRTVTTGGRRDTQPRTVSGADLSNPQIHTSNFLIEVYFRTAPGQKDAILIRKTEDAGYALCVNEAGGVSLTAKSDGAAASLASRRAVNDGQWHHVIAEADRKAGTFTIYLDGGQDVSGPGLGADASLANDADLCVGGTPQGHNLNGAIDFLRLTRGTLADSKTTIEELYAWEFHGPFLQDFTGRQRPVDGGYAGAIDSVGANNHSPVRAATTNSTATETSALAPSKSPSATWLSGADKSEQWKAATQHCRELLPRLNLQETLVQKYLPKVREKIQFLLRSPDLDWKKRTAVDYLENMLEDLMAGREPPQRYAGKEFGYPYWSPTMERIEAIWVHVPPEYDPAQRYQLFMYYKCGGGIHLKDGKVTGGYRPTAEVANQTDSFHAWSSLDIQVKGRMGAQIELEEATAAFCQDFSVDPDRIFLTGWSDGGFTALWLGSRYPHLVAGIAPVCGNWQYGNIEDIGLWNIPTLAVDGWSDGGYNNLQFCRWLALRGQGADARCLWGHHGHSYQPYEDVEEFKFIMNWAKSHKRDLYPRKVRYATWNLQWNHAYWFSVERVVSPVLAAQFEAEIIDDNQIRVQTWNVAAYRLALSDRLVDPQKPIRVVTDGKQSYAGPFQPDLLIELAPRPEGKFVKEASLPDDITTAIKESFYDTKGLSAIPSRPWLSVRPTGWSGPTAGLLAQWLPQNAKADNDINEDDLARYNLVVYGGPDINRLTARIAADLPVKFGPGRFVLGKTIYDRASHSVAFIHPNPLNPRRYVIVYAFNDAEAFARNLFFGMTGGGFSEFRAGDCLVFGIPAARGPWGETLDNRAFVTRHVMFDAAWKADTSPPLGELEQPFDYLQILRLKADAVREATGADIGIIWEHTPSWNRWGESLPAGAITLHDLATVDMFPENIVVADMTGADLRRAQPAAWTVVTDQREPAYDGKPQLAASDIVPAKTYRVAMGHFGQPSYGAEPGRMPKLFPFATPEDFLAVKTDRISLKNVRQLPLQVVEATAQFIRQHNKVSPRRICFDLTQYIINPQANDYGACDWLHLSIQTPAPGAAGRRAERYTLSLGLRGAGDLDPAPPRANSKHFLDLGEKMKQPATFNFANLDKHLPLTVDIGSEEHAITAEREFKTFALAPAESKENALGRCLLIDVKLANTGLQDVDVTTVLSAAELRAPYGQVWPDEDNKDERGYYAGYHRSVGEYRQPPVHEDAALLLFVGAMPKTAKLMAPNAGYNFGLAGIKTPLTVRAGQTLTLPLLLIAVDSPRGANVSLAEILASLRNELARRIR